MDCVALLARVMLSITVTCPEVNTNCTNRSKVSTRPKTENEKRKPGSIGRCCAWDDKKIHILGFLYTAATVSENVIFRQLSRAMVELKVMMNLQQKNENRAARQHDKDQAG